MLDAAQTGPEMDEEYEEDIAMDVEDVEELLDADEGDEEDFMGVAEPMAGPGGMSPDRSYRHEEAPHGEVDGAGLELMLDLPLDVTVELGRTMMQLGEALALQPGSIIELNRLPGEPLDMHINERLVARGEVVVVNDSLGLRITEIIGRSSGRD